jgi:peptidoglycan/LPS O-acetylase OafA/YrhL
MILGLDGIRAIAFILVFAIHTDYLNFGWTGVQLFFVLSGFLITGILLDMKQYLPGKAYFSKFYGRRFLRIFPLYYFYLILISGLTYFLRTAAYRINYMQRFINQLPYALTYVYNFFYASATFRDMKFLEHFWSLSVEEQFYVFWPLLIFFIPEKSLKKLFVGAIIAGPIFRFLFVVLYREFSMAFLRSSLSTGLYALPLTHLDAFAFGALITRIKIPRAKLQLGVLFILAPILGFSAYYMSAGTFGDLTSLGFPFSMPKAYQYIWGYSLLNYLFVLVIYCVAKEKLFIKFLELKFLRYLGKISYGLYVYHGVVIWFMSRIRDLYPMTDTVAKPLTAFLSFVVTVVIASLSYSLLEKPLLIQKDKFFALKAPAVVDKPPKEVVGAHN